MMLVKSLVLFFLVTQSNAQDLASDHLRSTEKENAVILRWVNEKAGSLKDWISHRGEKGGPPDFIDFSIPNDGVETKPSTTEAEIAKNTKALYDQYFPKGDPSSYVGTFFESGHPYIETKRGPYQWDSLNASGMDDPELFKEAVEKLVQKGIKSFRLGPNLHEISIENSGSWSKFVDKLEIIWRAGGTPTISVAFFPSFKRWEVKMATGAVDYTKSYILNPEWPADLGKMTEGLMTELWKRAETVERELGHEVHVVINPVNEPETLAGFNRQFWHGAFAPWGSAEMMRYYIPSTIRIAEANVQVRLAVEKTSGKRRVLFMHNEAMTPEYYPSHSRFARFAVSKFMLGDQQLLNADLNAYLQKPLEQLKTELDSARNAETISEIDYSFRQFVFGSWNKTAESKEEARFKLVNDFSKLKALHAELEKTFGKTMKTDNMLHLDYYYQTEFVPPKALSALADDFAANQGEKLKAALGVKDDEAFLNMLRSAAQANDADLPPEGPKGAIVFFPFKTRSEIDFKKLLTQSEYVMLERLIGFRRDYTFADDAVSKIRQSQVGLRPLESQLWRTDTALSLLLTDQAKLLRSMLNTNSATELRAALAKVGLNNEDGNGVVQIPAHSTLREILELNGRTIFHRLLGIKRTFFLGFEPQHYARQVRAGIRFGFYRFFLEYVNSLRVFTAGVGESGTPFYVFAPLLHDQVMMEYGLALKTGIYGTQYSFGPGVDTRGWAKAPLGLHYDDDHEVNPSGILKRPTPAKESGLEFRGNENSIWLDQFLQPFFKTISGR